MQDGTHNVSCLANWMIDLPTQKVIQTIQSLAKGVSPGPSPAYTSVHVSRAILCIGDEGPIGRIELSRKLGVGEGSARTVIRHLAKARIIEIAKGGCVLTGHGLGLYKALRLKLSKPCTINARQLALDKWSVAVRVNDASRLVKTGIEQRDAAVRAGATGACTLIFRDGRLVMPVGVDRERTITKNEVLFQEIQRALTPGNGDAIAIVSAPTREMAEYCAVAAALTLIS